MTRKIKTRIRMNEGKIELLVLINHPMETGLRRDKQTKKLVPAHFITNVTIRLNGEILAMAELGRSISRNPLLGFRLKQASSGETLRISWFDNRGESGSIQTPFEL